MKDIKSISNYGKSITAERFTKTLKAKIYKNVTANDSKSYLHYLDKLVDQCNNTFHCYINKKLINAGILLSLKKLRPTNPKAPKFKVSDRVRIIKYKNIFSKACYEN